MHVLLFFMHNRALVSGERIFTHTCPSESFLSLLSYLFSSTFAHCDSQYVHAVYTKLCCWIFSSHWCFMLPAELLIDSYSKLCYFHISDKVNDGFFCFCVNRKLPQSTLSVVFSVLTCESTV